MEITINNVKTNIIADEFYHYFDGVCVYFGAITLDEKLFVPFFMPNAHGYTPEFEKETLIPIEADSPETTDLDEDRRDIVSIIEAFNYNRAKSPTHVTNVKLFNHLAKSALIRKNRRVSWGGTEEQGTVMMIDNNLTEVLWDEHKGSKLGLFTYNVKDPRIQPVPESLEVTQ